ncbi:RNA polymerase sigma factor SigZ [Vibrio sp. SCSIO 43140]|uniref:RNA polymerase sigma factor SigZ n=1 Tax=Vibrio sp. SCSIO 43140 TaxID=2819100 RepID=UPI002074C5B5|nr:RNA polymerase sigma factor SigZ [Vibrio sp. SCSIO 43140]USD63280.1 RNA polymerase sigma factor SigZ [Vibrio sp. SCSIO 43140]
MLEAVWSEYQNGLRRFLRSKIANEADVDDVLQEVLIKTYKNIDKLESPESVKSWLFQIANRSVIDHYRKDNATEDVDLDTFWTEEEEEQVSRELAECLLPMMESLPESTTALIKSIDIDGRSQKEVAAELGISYSTLKSRVQKSRHELRVVYEKCCQFSFDTQGNVMNYHPKSKKCNNC